MEDKIKKVVNSIVSSYERKFEEIINACDSPIEKLLFLHIVDQIMNYGTPRHPGDSLIVGTPILEIHNEIHFLEDFLWLEAEYLDDKREWNLRKDKFKFQWLAGANLYAASRYMGVEFTETWSANSLALNSNEEYCHRVFQIIPQYLFMAKNNYFIDIAIITKLRYEKSGKEIEEVKLGIECDGHEFHSTPEQKERDNIRARELTKNGWKIIRYSGREINRLDESKAGEVVSEIFQILSKTLK